MRVLLGDERGNRRSQQSRQGHRRTGRGQRIRQRSRSGHQRGWSQRRIVLAVVDDGRCRRCVVGWQPPVQRDEVSDGTEHDEPSGARSRRERLCQLADVQYGIPIGTAVGGFAVVDRQAGARHSSATVSVTKNSVALGATWESHRDASVMPEQQSSFMVANSNLRPASGTISTTPRSSGRCECGSSTAQATTGRPSRRLSVRGWPGPLRRTESTWSPFWRWTGRRSHGLLYYYSRVTSHERQLRLDCDVRTRSVGPLRRLPRSGAPTGKLA